jgi:hypothetical protein
VGGVRPACLGVLLLGACGESASVVAEVRVADNTPTPASLAVSIYDQERARVRNHVIDSPRLPGVLVVMVPPGALRLVVAGRSPSLLGGAAFEAIAGVRTPVVIELSALRGDRDGDGVPDDLDHCPDHFDPEQADADQDGRGDACQPSPDLAGPEPDLSAPGADLADVDLAGADLASADLKTLDLATPDLAPVTWCSGASTCATAGVALCDGFEAATINTAVWTAETSRGSVSSDTTRACRGQRSFRSSVQALTGAQDADAELAETQTFNPTTPADYFMRLFVYVPSTVPQNNVSLFATQEATNFKGPNVLTVANKLTLDNQIPTPGVLFTGPTLPVDRWVCLEMEVQVAAAGRVNLWMDDVALPALSQNQNTNPTPRFTRFVIGVYANSTGVAVGPYDIWFDEVMFDTQRIGCAK